MNVQIGKERKLTMSIAPLMRETEYVYHGSPYLFDVLKPQQASGENADCSRHAIYASDQFDYVIPFALPIRWYPDNPAGKRDFQCNSGRVKILQGTLDPNGVGYIYKLKAEHFEKIDNWQWVAYQEVEPEEIIKIDVRDYMDRVTFSEEARKATDELYGL